MFIHVTRYEDSHPNAPICIHFSQHIDHVDSISTDIQMSLEEARTLSTELREVADSIQRHVETANR